MKQKDRKAFYASRKREIETSIRRYRSRNHGFIFAEIFTFLIALGGVVLFTILQNASWTLWLATVFLVAYVVVRRLDELNDEQIVRSESLAQVYERELAYLSGDFSSFDDGTRYMDASHPFTTDLDVFGPLSLFQRINRTVSLGGADRLAAILRSLNYQAERSKAINELSEREQFLTNFKTFGIRGRLETVAVKRAMHDVCQLVMPRYLVSSVTLAVVVVLLLGLWASILLAAFGQCAANIPVAYIVSMFFLTFFLCNGVLKRLQLACDSLLKNVKTLVGLIRLIDDEEFLSSYNQTLYGHLKGALSSFEALASILQRLDRRGNILGLLLLDGFFAGDFFIIRKFWQWQNRFQSHFSQWLDVVCQMDALVSMATFRYNEPNAVQANVIDDAIGEVVYQAKELYHPFLGNQAIPNDFVINNRNYYIITGANMAGKSTFLRSLGINYLLAMAGLPVFCKSLRVSRFHMFTSMRTTDDLSHGISYFNAELLRLKSLLQSVASCEKGSEGSPSLPTLIILDEILKGTNSLDKLNGSRLFLEYISHKNVTGVVATHDLELSKMSENYPDRFHNYCFEIELGKTVSYSYLVTKGVARNQNATYLLREILNEAEDENKKM